MRRLALPFVLTLFAAAVAAAQAELPTPEAPGGRKPIDRPHWSFEIGAEESYESNVPYTEFLGQDDFVTRGTAQLQVQVPIRRGLIELGGQGGFNVYRTVQGLNRYTWGATGRLEHRFTRQSSIEAQLRSSQGYARDNSRLLITGALPPLTLTRNDSAEALWRQHLAGSFEMHLAGRAERFRFDAPGLQNGWTAGGRLGFENAFGRRLWLGVEGEYDRTSTEPNSVATIGNPVLYPNGQTFNIQRLVATLRYQIVRHLELLLDGGAARFEASSNPVPTPTPTPSPTPGTGTGTEPPTPSNAPVISALAAYQPTITPTGTATLTGIVGKHTISAMASRRVEQTYGVGAVGINSTVALSYRWDVAKWVALTALGSDNHNAAPDATLLSSGRTLTTGFDFSLPAQIALRMNYAYWDRQDPGRNWTNHTVAFGVAKRFDFH